VVSAAGRRSEPDPVHLGGGPDRAVAERVIVARQLVAHANAEVGDRAALGQSLAASRELRVSVRFPIDNRCLGAGCGIALACGRG